MDSAPSLDFPELSDLDDDQAYEVKLEAFTGPMDLLLHLIRKQKINCADYSPIFGLSLLNEDVKSLLGRRVFGDGSNVALH